MAIHSSSDGGVTATHAEQQNFPVKVGPSTDSDKFNRVTMGIVPIACWRVDDVRFQFDSSFVLPQVAAEMKALERLRNKHKQDSLFPPISLFGHADPVGDDDYNKTLSGRRATAIYAMLIRNPSQWETLYTTRIRGVGDVWGKSSIDTMVHALGFDSVQGFQQKNGLAADGDPGPATRGALFPQYMDLVCGSLKLDKHDHFLAGTDSGGKGDYQGCSEFNPVLIFSTAESQKFAKPENKADRDRTNAPNRRVMALLFRPGSKVDANKWPCPRASEGVAGCHHRFWSNGETRRSTQLPDQERKYDQTKDTFACRFYDRIANQSPCDRLRQILRVRLYDGFARALPFAPFQFAPDGGDTFSDIDFADDLGIITIQLPSSGAPPSSVTVKWAFPPKDGEDPVMLFQKNIFLIAPDEAADQAVIKKLSNLGYDSDDQTRNVLGFQLDYGSLVDPFLDQSGELDDRTRDLIDDVYEQSASDLRKTQPQGGV